MLDFTQYSRSITASYVNTLTRSSEFVKSVAARTGINFLIYGISIPILPKIEAAAVGHVIEQAALAGRIVAHPAIYYKSAILATPTGIAVAIVCIFAVSFFATLAQYGWHRINQHMQ